MTEIKDPVKCTRCHDTHPESARSSHPRPHHSVPKVSDTVCPVCGGTLFLKLKKQVAWCWSSGLIEVGSEMPADGPNGAGAILIAEGPWDYLHMALGTLARHGQGKSRGLLLVPGVPEAEGQQAKGNALAAWLDWCGRFSVDAGVVFFQEGSARA
jgi:DNA-directed RNA polymerase subunit RPC12/RpoP